ncbi:MAG: recombinase family protein [Ruminococcus flavefaciens]|nr:recombinase family protein [Ruminococcus flavefaciens]
MDEYCMYLRKSRVDLDAEARGEGETLARHQTMLMELAKRQGLNVVKIYKEIVSGDSISARPQMQMLLSDLAQNKYTGVLVVEVERLARGDTIDQGIVAQAFKQSDTKIITPVKTYDPNNEFDEEYFEFSLFMSRREYKTIKRRMQAGRLASVKEGNYICSRTPYGYRKVSPDPKTHTLEIVPEEAETVKLIYKMYLDGHGAKFISAELNRMGIRPQKSELWETPSVKKILTNPLYCGKIGWNNKSNGSTLYQGKHKAIVSEEVFNAVQDKKKNNPVAQLHPNDVLLNYYHGILYCKNCGHQMKRRYLASNGHEHLLCAYSQCRGMTVGASFEEVDNAVLTAFRYRIEKLSELSDTQQPKHEEVTIDQRKPIEVELSKSKKQQDRLYDLLEQGIYDANTFLERSKVVSEKIKTLENALAEIESQSEPEKLPVKELKVRLQYVIDNFSIATPEEKNTMLKNVVQKIHYTKTQRMCNHKRFSDLTLEVDFL